MADETVLVISGNGLPPYAARGLTQTLEPIAASVAPRRTVNGGLINLAPEQFQKYASTISCTDMDPPALDGVWPGAILTIDCAEELGYPTAGSPSAGPQRTVVPGSMRVKGDYTYYRPQLVMMVVGPWRQSFDEYGAATAWELPLEEV